MTRPRKRGRVEGRPGARGAARQGSGGLVVPQHAVEAVRAKQAMGFLESVRYVDCEDPRCPKSGERHAEYLCAECTAADGMPRYHLEPEDSPG